MVAIGGLGLISVLCWRKLGYLLRLFAGQNNPKDKASNSEENQNCWNSTIDRKTRNRTCVVVENIETPQNKEDSKADSNPTSHKSPPRGQ